MAINKKLIFWKKNTFNPPTSPTDETQDVLWYSIVFFSDQITDPQYAGKIWTNGQIFDTSVSTHHTHNQSLNTTDNVTFAGVTAGAITSSGIITGTGFSKTGATDAHMLLGSGGHKAISDFNASLVTSTTKTGTTNVATSNTNTYLNIVQGGSSVRSSTQIVGSNGVTVASDTTGKLTITGLGAHAGIYSSRANGPGASSNSIESKDTRSINPLPSTDLQRGVWFDFKTNSAIGLTGASTYSSVITMVPYGDNSGNSNTAFRLAQSGNNLYFQNWTAVWGTWNKLWHSGNLANGTTSQYIRGDGSLATYTDTTYSTGTLDQLNAGTDTTGRLQTAKLLNDWLNPKLNSKFDKTGGRLTTGTGDVNIELWRETNASWNILNSGGYLRFQSNYTTVVGAYFDALKLDYNTGNALFKGNVTAPTFIGALSGNASSASTVTLTADNTTNATRYPLFASAATGNLSPSTDTGFTYNPSTGALTANTFIGSSTVQATTAILTNLTTNYLPKQTASGLANSIIYDNGTNVGIGTNSPQYKLDVNGQIGSNGKQIAYITDVNYFSNQTQATYIESSDDALYARMPKGTFPIYHSGHFNINNYLSKDGGVMNNRQLVGNLNAEFLGGNSYLEVFPYTTNRNFVNGTFITTSIDYSQSEGDPFYLEIKGNSYGRMNSVYTLVQGYIYSNTIIQYGVTHLSYEKISGLVALNVNGNLCFWFPRQSYWEGYSINVWSAFNYSKNRVVNVTDVAKPSGTKEVNLTSNTKTSLFHTENLTNTVIPKWDGTQLVDSILRDDGTDLLVTGSRNINIYSGKIGYSPTSDIFTSGGITYANYGLSINTGKIGLSGYLGLALYTQSEERLTVLQNGNVGIGTDAPQYKLDVNGSARIDGGSVRLPATTGIGTDSPAGDYDFAVKANFSMYTPELKVQMQATDWGGYSIYYKGSFLLIGNTEFDFWSTGEKFNFNKDLYVQTKKVLHEGNINDKLELAAYAAETITNPSGTLALKFATETVITNTLTSSNSISISLPSPTSGRVNESILIFKIGASLPTITQPSGIVYRISIPSLVINSTWTFVYEQVWNGSSWEIYCSSAKNA